MIRPEVLEVAQRHGHGAAYVIGPHQHTLWYDLKEALGRANMPLVDASRVVSMLLLVQSDDWEDRVDELRDAVGEALDATATWAFTGEPPKRPSLAGEPDV